MGRKNRLWYFKAWNFCIIMLWATEFLKHIMNFYNSCGTERLSVCQSINLAVCLFSCIPVCMSVCLCVHLFDCLSVCLSVSLSVFQYVYQSFDQKFPCSILDFNQSFVHGSFLKSHTSSSLTLKDCETFHVSNINTTRNSQVGINSVSEETNRFNCKKLWVLPESEDDVPQEKTFEGISCKQVF